MKLDLKKLKLRDVNEKLQNIDRKQNDRNFTIINPEGNHAVCAGLTEEMNINIKGHVGYYCAGMNQNANIVIDGNVGTGVAENMMSGKVHVKGNASQSAGATAHGGLLVIDGDASSRCGISMKGIDIVVNTCGPYFKFGAPILAAAISSGCNYIDICDDWEPTIDMMKLDAKAKSAGVTATIGLGASPGLTNLMALIAIGELDEVTTVYTGWDIGGTSLDENAMQQSENAAMMHGVEQMTGQVKIFQNGNHKIPSQIHLVPILGCCEQTISRPRGELLSNGCKRYQHGFWQIAIFLHHYNFPQFDTNFQRIFE